MGVAVTFVKLYIVTQRKDSGFSSKEHLNPLSALPMKMLFTSLSNLEQDKTLCAKDENTI